MALRSPVFLKLRLDLVALQHACHAYEVLMRKPVAHLDAPPQDASFLVTAEHWTALRSPVFLKLRLQLVAMQDAYHTYEVLMRNESST